MSEKTYICTECQKTFVASGSIPCPSCGGTVQESDVSPQKTVMDPGGKLDTFVEAPQLSGTDGEIQEPTFISAGSDADATISEPVNPFDSGDLSDDPDDSNPWDASEATMQDPVQPEIGATIQEPVEPEVEATMQEPVQSELDATVNEETGPEFTFQNPPPPADSDAAVNEGSPAELDATVNEPAGDMTVNEPADQDATVNEEDLKSDSKVFQDQTIMDGGGDALGATIKQEDPGTGSSTDVAPGATIQMGDDTKAALDGENVHNMQTIQDGGSSSSGSVHTAATIVGGDTGSGATIKQEGGSGGTSVTAPGHVSSGKTTFPTMATDSTGAPTNWTNYEIIDELARGGMGVVYKAKQKSLNRTVAIKLMLSGANASEMEKKRFIREAEATAALKHPNIVDIIEIGQYEGNFYFAMEFVEGETFDAYCKRADITLEQKLEKFVDVLEGMQFAHEHKIIHRDLKPVNVMLDKAGTPKIMDFGLAKKLKDTEDEEELSLKTATGAIMGTPHYMSPEQASGDTHNIDTRTDIFALGVIMYEMVTGVRPFRGNSIQEIMYSIFNAEPQRPTEMLKGLDWELEAIILKAIEKEIPTRYHSVEEMKKDIQRFLNGETIQARKISRLYLLKKKIKKNKLQFAMAAVITILVLASASYFSWAYYENKQKTARMIAGYEDDSKELITKAEELLGEGAVRLDYSDVETKLEETKKVLANLETVDKDNITLQKTRIRIDQAQKDIKDKITHASALKKCEKAEAVLGQAIKDLKEGDENDDKKKRIEGKKGVLNAMQQFNEAYIMKPDLARANDGRYQSAMVLGSAAKHDKGFDLAILMFTQAEGIKKTAEVAKLLKETEDEANDLQKYKDFVDQGKVDLAAKKWDEAERNFGFAKDITESDEVKKLLEQTEYGRELDEAKATAQRGNFQESIKRLASLKQDTRVSEEDKNKLDGEIAKARQEGIKSHLKIAQGYFQKLDYVKADKELDKVFALDSENGPAKELRTLITELTSIPENMVYIKGGEFQKGTAEAEASNPVGKLELPSYYISKYEVSNAEYNLFIQDGGYTNEKYWDEEGWKAVKNYVCTDGKTAGPSTWIEGKYPVGQEDYPVTGISLYEARAYAKWKSSNSARTFRLCDEFEWEKAASWNPETKKQQVYPWGQNWDMSMGNFGDDPEKIGYVKTDCSPYGCFDVAGNVAEWVDSQNGAAGGLRGGTYGLPESILKIFARGFYRNRPETYHYRSPFVGFRIASSVRDSKI